MKRLMLLASMMVLPVGVQADITKQVYQAEIVEEMGDVTGRSNIGGKRTTVSVDDINGSRIATLKWTYKPEVIKTEGLNFEFKLQAPFEKEQKDNELLNFDGLANSTKFTFGTSYLLSNDHPERVVRGQDLSFHELGFNYTVGTETFNYVDASDITDKQEERQTGQSIGAYYAYYAPKFMLGFNYFNEVSYKAGSKKHLCYEYSENITQCSDFVIGPPQRKTSHLVKIEGRRKFSNSDVTYGLNIIHNLDDSVTKVQMPVYLSRASQIKDKKDKKDKEDEGSSIDSIMDIYKDLGGGVRVSWDSDTRETRVGFFVGYIL